MLTITFNSNKESTKKKEYSKKIVYWTGLLFLSQLVLASIAVFTSSIIDYTIFMYTIPATGGVFGASIIFYLNKAKLENVLKIKIAFTKFKLKISHLISPEAMQEVENEFLALEDALNMKIDNTMNETIDKEIEIQP